MEKKIYKVQVQLVSQDNTTVVASNPGEAEEIIRKYILENPDSLWIRLEEKERRIE